MAFPSREVKFMKIISLILDTGTIALSCRLKHELKKAGVTFKDFLSIHKHALFHLYEKRNCCNCVQSDQRRITILLKPQWEILFKVSLKSCNKQRPCLCQYKSQDKVSEEDMDLSLLCSVLLNTCSLLPAEIQDIKNLREKRNNLFHSIYAKIEEDAFQREFLFIRSTIESIASPCGAEVLARVTEAIDNISKSPLNDNMCQHVLSLLYYIKDSTNEELRRIRQILENHLDMQPRSANDLSKDKQDKQVQCTSVNSEDRRDDESCNGTSDALYERNNETAKMYFQETSKGTETIRRAHAMILGCSGAGKTTLLMRLMSKDLCMEEPNNVCSTVGVNIFPDLFEINPQSFSLKVCSKDSIKEKKLLLNVLDFGGQCAYYACHQVYLQQRAFFLQVVDISKPLEEKVDPFLCNQDGTMFANYTYGDYFLFWLKWIHTYCDSDTPVIIVATHLDLVPDPQKMKSSFFQRILDLLPPGSNLERHLSNERCFFTGYPFKFCPQSDPLAKLEKCICSIALSEKWIVNIPTEWVWYGDSICCLLNKEVKLVKRGGLYHQKVFAESEDLMKFYNDIGVIGYFNERLLRDIVIVDVKWFADAFKYVITDRNHFYWITVKDNFNHDWMYFNQTGYLKDSLLNEIWKQTFSVGEDKEDILLYAERLGLLARGESHCLRSRVHYVPSMNKRIFDSTGKHLFKTVKNRTTVIVYQFQFFPYFYYFRLIVAMMSDQMPFNLLDSTGEYLYKDLACFLHKDHIVVVAATPTSIQLQVLNRKNEVQRGIVIEIRNLIEKRLREITETFQRPCRYTVGFQCSYQEVYSHLPDCFVREQDILGKVKMPCPAHLKRSKHNIKEEKIVHFWKEIILDTSQATASNELSTESGQGTHAEVTSTTVTYCTHL